MSNHRNLPKHKGNDMLLSTGPWFRPYTRPLTLKDQLERGHITLATKPRRTAGDNA